MTKPSASGTTDPNFSFSKDIHRSMDHEGLIQYDFRRQVARRLSFFLFFVFICGSILRHYVAPIPQELIITNIIIAIFLGLNFALTYMNVHVLIPSMGIVITLTIVAASSGYLNAGVMAPANGVLISIPLIGYFFGGLRLGFIGFTLSLIVLWTQYFQYPLTDLNQVRHPELYTRYKSVIYTAIILFSALIGVAYEKARRMSQKALQTLYKKIWNWKTFDHLVTWLRVWLMKSITLLLSFNPVFNC
jgi:hypothetical protein